MADTLQNWLDGYLRAWASNEPDDIRALFTDDASYAGHPLDPEPAVGREAIVAWWIENADGPHDWSFTGAPLTHSGDLGVIEGLTQYSDGRTYANLWVIHFADDGRARSFVEWYMTKPQ